ncbi:MAG: hypothetical protein O2992_03880 [Gemmatimonadetes bacterium]|nr:hypothetical protein [Gemmatimonadota bacterium]
MPFHLVPARDRKLHRLVKKATSVRMAKGRSLYVAGDPAKDVFLVLDGFVRLVLPGMEKGRGPSPSRSLGRSSGMKPSRRVIDATAR